MRRRLLLSYVSLTAVVLLLLEVPLGVTLARRERDAASSSALRDATTLGALAEEGLDRPDLTDLRGLSASYRARTGADVAVLHDGSPVVAFAQIDADDAAALLRHVQAVAGRGANLTGTFNDDTHQRGYAAAPIRSAGGVKGVVVVAYRSGAVERRVHDLWLGLGVLALVVLGVAGAVGDRLAASVTRPLADLESTVAVLGGGDLTARATGGSGPAEVRALSDAFNEMASRLEELVGAQRRFVADASHQLRTPLTALRLRLESLELQGAADDDVAAAMREVLRLSRIVDGLLALARSEGVRPDRVPLDARAVVEDRRLAWAPLAEERGVELRVEGTPEAVMAVAVPGYLEQIIDNLLANALDASPPGRAVVLGVRPGELDVMVHVVDDGPGMSAVDRARAFDRFWRGRDGVSGGSGLGLAIVAQLATACGADVELRPADPLTERGIDAVVRLQRA